MKSKKHIYYIMSPFICDHAILVILLLFIIIVKNIFKLVLLFYDLKFYYIIKNVL